MSFSSSSSSSSIASLDSSTITVKFLTERIHIFDSPPVPLCKIALDEITVALMSHYEEYLSGHYYPEHGLLFVHAIISNDLVSQCEEGAFLCIQYHFDCYDMEVGHNTPDVHQETFFLLRSH